MTKKPTTTKTKKKNPVLSINVSLLETVPDIDFMLQGAQPGLLMCFISCFFFSYNLRLNVKSKHARIKIDQVGSKF